MNWILLIIAGLFEVGFATCLGKANAATGKIQLLWMTGFITYIVISMYLLYRVNQALPIGLPMRFGLE